MQLAEFLRASKRNGILIDTNLLVLWIVGTVNRTRITSFKRTSAFDEKDFDALHSIAAEARCFYTVPHVLAEVTTSQI